MQAQGWVSKLHTGVWRIAVSTQTWTPLWRFRVFGGCTAAEIKVVKAPCLRSLITSVHPDLEESGVCLLIRRYNLPLTRQLSHDTPINLLKKKSFKGSVESVKTVSRLNAPWKQFITRPSAKSSQNERFRQFLYSLCLPSRQLKRKSVMFWDCQDVFCVLSILLSIVRKLDTLRCFWNELLPGKFLSKWKRSSPKTSHITIHHT